ncbi:hypothetical protein NC652_027199 [Populus alba x Populus x berolinensis]|nr:hypothetical protein NC652_027199 [Populus alba x Populus x berolinensis]
MAEKAIRRILSKARKKQRQGRQLHHHKTPSSPSSREKASAEGEKTNKDQNRRGLSVSASVQEKESRTEKKGKRREENREKKGEGGKPHRRTPDEHRQRRTEKRASPADQGFCNVFPKSVDDMCYQWLKGHDGDAFKKTLSSQLSPCSKAGLSSMTANFFQIFGAVDDEMKLLSFLQKVLLCKLYCCTFPWSASA